VRSTRTEQVRRRGRKEVSVSWPRQRKVEREGRVPSSGYIHIDRPKGASHGSNEEGRRRD